MINPPTKFEVTNFTHYGDMKGIAKVENGVVSGHPRSLALSPFDTVHTTSYLSLIRTMHLSWVPVR